MVAGAHADHPPDKRILYIADPMCSWCWGFSPVIGAIAEAAAGRAWIKVVVGGLRPGTTEPMVERAKAAVRHHWEQVLAETGQPFDFGFFDRDAFVYDTEPACRAVVVVRGLDPALALPYFEHVQRSFYATGRDVTSGDVLADLATGFVDPGAFRERFAAPEWVAAMRSDFALAQSLGIAGFPAVVLADDAGYRLLTMGYQRYEQLGRPLERWLAT